MWRVLCCGVTLSLYLFADYVYFENSSSNPYLIRRIEELNKVSCVCAPGSPVPAGGGQGGPAFPVALPQVVIMDETKHAPSPCAMFAGA